jgi:hypothetical protein
MEERRAYDVLNKMLAPRSRRRATEGRAMAKEDFDLRKVTSPVLLHLLGKELRYPRLFLWRCLLTVGRFKRSIDARFPAELVDLAATPIWVYINLKERIGQRKAFEILRVAILAGGVTKWNLQFETVDHPRTFENLFDQELRVNQTGLTRWNTLEVVEHGDRRFELKVTRCLYHELAKALGVPELTPIVCQIDNAAFNSYLPDQVLFHREGPKHRIADGAKECRFVLELEE